MLQTNTKHHQALCATVLLLRRNCSPRALAPQNVRLLVASTSKGFAIMLMETTRSSPTQTARAKLRIQVRVTNPYLSKLMDQQSRLCRFITLLLSPTRFSIPVETARQTTK